MNNKEQFLAMEIIRAQLQTFTGRLFIGQMIYFFIVPQANSTYILSVR